MTTRKNLFISDLRTYAQTIGGTFEAAEKSHDREGSFAEQFTDAYRNAALWLQPLAIKNYDKSDWKDLNEENQKELDQCVSRYSEFAGRTTSTSGPPKSDYDEAFPIFRRICELTGAVPPDEENIH